MDADDVFWYSFVAFCVAVVLFLVIGIPWLVVDTNRDIARERSLCESKGGELVLIDKQPNVCFAPEAIIDLEGD